MWLERANRDVRTQNLCWNLLEFNYNISLRFSETLLHRGGLIFFFPFAKNPLQEVGDGMQKEWVNKATTWQLLLLEHGEAASHLFLFLLFEAPSWVGTAVIPLTFASIDCRLLLESLWLVCSLVFTECTGSKKKGSNRLVSESVRAVSLIEISGASEAFKFTPQITLQEGFLWRNSPMTIQLGQALVNQAKSHADSIRGFGESIGRGVMLEAGETKIKSHQN